MRRNRLLFCIVLFVLLCAPLVVSAKAASEWDRTYGEGTSSESANSLVATSDGGYALAGVTSFGFGGDSWLVKTDSLGNLQWNQTYGGTSPDGAHSLVATSNGGYAIAGFTYSFGAGGPADFWLVKTDEFGNYPEYSSWLVPGLVLTATALVIISKKRKRKLS